MVGRWSELLSNEKLSLGGCCLTSLSTETFSMLGRWRTLPPLDETLSMFSLLVDLLTGLWVLFGGLWHIFSGLLRRLVDLELLVELLVELLPAVLKVLAELPL